MMRFFADRRALDQTVGNLLVLMVTLSAISMVLAVISPILAQYTSRNQIREAEALMTSLYDEIMKVQEEPVGSRRVLEIEIKDGGIELMNDPPRMILYVDVQKKVDFEIEETDFAYTARGAMLRKNLTLPFYERGFIGPGANLVYISKTQSGTINVTATTPYA
jgi:hypothetical protein